MARRHEGWNVGLAGHLRDPEFAREFLLGAIEEEVPLQVALGKVVGLIAATGLRIGELLALRWRSLDLAIGTLSVRESVFEGKTQQPKTQKARRRFRSGRMRSRC